MHGASSFHAGIDESVRELALSLQTVLIILTVIDSFLLNLLIKLEQVFIVKVKQVVL